jgi:signal peptidase I
MAKTKPHLKRGQAPAKPRTFQKRLFEEIKGYAEALAIAFLIVTFVFNTVGVVGSSMQPNLNGGVGSRNILRSLLTGDRVFIPKYDNWLRRINVLGPYRRGDIVIVREPKNAPTAQERDRRPFFIKRIIAIPGDYVRIESGQVYVNDHAIDQNFIVGTGQITPDEIDFPLVIVESGEVTKIAVHFANTIRGTPIPQLARSGFPPKPVDINDPRVQLYYGSTVKALATPSSGLPDDQPVVLDLIVPENSYFIMGDNRQGSKGGSEDSRFFGPVRALTIAGRTTAVIWPPRREGGWNWRILRPPKAFKDIPTPPGRN